MRKYIVDLTNDLINRCRYDLDVDSFNTGKADILERISLDLQHGGPVSRMHPATLGEIMAAFEIGDVMLTREEIFKKIIFSGDCEDLLREIVSVCLAAAMYERLQPDECRNPAIPPYLRKKTA